MVMRGVTQPFKKVSAKPKEPLQAVSDPVVCKDFTGPELQVSMFVQINIWESNFYSKIFVRVLLFTDLHSRIQCSYKISF